MSYIWDKHKEVPNGIHIHFDDLRGTVWALQQMRCRRIMLARPIIHSILCHINSVRVLCQYLQVQQEVLQKRQKEKKEMMEAVKSFKKRKYTARLTAGFMKT